MDPPEQLTEHCPVQVTSQADPPAQETLLLGPTVSEQDELLPQSMLHESLQVPLQTLSLAQASEQLPAPPQLFWEKLQFEPLGQVQLAPVQVGGWELLPPQPKTKAKKKEARRVIRIPH